MADRVLTLYSDDVEKVDKFVDFIEKIIAFKQ